MKQNIKVNGSKDVTIIQAGGDVVYYQPQKTEKLSPEKIEELTRNYRRFIIDRYKTIPCLDVGVSLTMENYIPLQLGEEKREERPNKREPKESEESSGKYIDFKVWREIHSIQEMHSLTPVDVWRAVRNKKIVVKGDPGSGKTTLLSYIAYSLGNQTNEGISRQDQHKAFGIAPPDFIPLIIDLKDWVGKRSTISLPEYYAKYALKESGFEQEIVPLIDEWLRSGKCIILCDGLDEVTEDRKSLIQSLQNLASGVYKDCHILVTTRIVGYHNELSGWQHYEMMPLKAENIKQYAEDYLKDKSSSFLSTLKNTPQIEPLSKNPLLLQILCFVFNQQKLILPTHRVELYKTAVNEMLNLREPEIPCSVKENVLQDIAIHFLEGKEVFEEDELRDNIKDFLKKKEETHNIDDVLKEIVQKSGLLYRLHDTKFIFLHLTFQEYLSASYIAKKYKDPSQFLKPVLFNPRFREVIRLTAGMIKEPEDTCKFIKFILSQKPPYYKIFHQPLLLAGLCIADIPDNQAESSLKALQTKILNKLWKLWKETVFVPLREKIDRIFAAISGAEKASPIINKLLRALKDKDKSMSWKAVRALGRLERADNRVIEALLKALEDKDLHVRCSVARSLGNLGCVDVKVIGSLINRLEDIGKDAADALGRLGRVNDKVINVLHEVLEVLEDKYSLARWLVASELCRLHHADDRVVKVLLEALMNKDRIMRNAVAMDLGSLDCTDDKVIEALLMALKDEYADVRGNAAGALGRLGIADDKVIEALLKALEDEDQFVRSHAAGALGRLGIADDKVIEALLKTLKDKDLFVRSYAVKSLDILGRADERSIDALLTVWKNEDRHVKLDIVEALGRLGRTDDKVINPLLVAFQDWDWFVRIKAAIVLTRLGKADDKVIEVLVGTVKREYEWEKESVYLSLQKLVEKQANEKYIRFPVPHERETRDETEH